MARTGPEFIKPVSFEFNYLTHPRIRVNRQCITILPYTVYIIYYRMSRDNARSLVCEMIVRIQRERVYETKFTRDVVT